MSVAIQSHFLNAYGEQDSRLYEGRANDLKRFNVPESMANTVLESLLKKHPELDTQDPELACFIRDAIIRVIGRKNAKQRFEALNVAHTLSPKPDDPVSKTCDSLLKEFDLLQEMGPIQSLNICFQHLDWETWQEQLPESLPAKQFFISLDEEISKYFSSHAFDPELYRTSLTQGRNTYLGLEDGW